MIRWNGVLGDGTKFTETTYLSESGQTAFFLDLYGTARERGRVGGTLTFRNVQGISDFDGPVQWIKFPDWREARYAGGFSVASWAVGSKYSPPPTGQPSLSQLQNREYNASLSLIGPDLPQVTGGEIERTVTWPFNDRLRYYGPEKVAGSINRPNGLLKGSYLDPVTNTKFGFSGVVFQKQGLASGTFLTGTGSGTVRIVPGTTFAYPGSEGAGMLQRPVAPPGTASPPAESSIPFDPAAAGRYNGVLTEGSSVTGSLESVVLASSGNLSGVLWIDGIRYAFRSHMLLDGTADFQVFRNGFPDPVEVHLQLVLANGTADGFGLNGSVLVDGTTQMVDAQRHPSFSRTLRAPQEGTYTLALLAPPATDSAIEPAGDGYGSLMVSYLGGASGLFVLADGSRVTLSGHVARGYDDAGRTTAEWSFHRPLYGRVPRGSIAGKATFRSVSGVSDVDGQWRWRKTAGVAAPSTYPDGFDTTRNLIGNRYSPPLAGSPALGGLSNDYHNIWIRFAGPDLSGLPGLDLTTLDRAATWTNTNRLIYFGPEKVSMKFNVRTGVVTGSFSDPAHDVSFEFGGVVLQRQGLVSGHLLTPSASGLFSTEAR
jgi:hypothetical protein